MWNGICGAMLTTAAQLGVVPIIRSQRDGTNSCSQRDPGQGPGCLGSSWPAKWGKSSRKLAPGIQPDIATYLRSHIEGGRLFCSVDVPTPLWHAGCETTGFPIRIGPTVADSTWMRVR